MIGSLAGLADPAIAALECAAAARSPLEGDAAVPEIYPKARAPATRLRKGPRTASPAMPGGPSASLKRIRAWSAPQIPTASDGARWHGIPYVDCYHYFDTLYFLSEFPLGSHDAYWLEQHCKRLRIFKDGEILYGKVSAKYPRGRKRIIRVFPPYRFLIEAHVPDREALELLVRHPLKLIAAHPARDFTFDHEQDKLAMLALFERCWRQPYQRQDRDAVRYDLGLSTGRRPKGRYDTAYASKPCRIDGIVECFHHDGRDLGSAVLRRIGLGETLNLLNFDFAGYFRKKDQDSLRDIDLKRLGQYHRNRQRRSRSRQADEDQRLGGLIFRIHAIEPDGEFSIRAFIRNYGNGPYVRKADEIRGSQQIIRIGSLDRAGEHA